MPTLYIANAFSLNMLDRNMPVRSPEPVQAHKVQATIADYEETHEIRSIVGHQDTAVIFSSILGEEIPYNRESVKLGFDDALLVGQYTGPRLPEGATELPEGAKIEWWLI